MKSHMETNQKTQRWSRFAAPLVALAIAASFATYEVVRPIPASAAAATSNTQPLDDNSVGALLSLDRAMETLAARVTPAIVHVAVTAHPKAEQANGEMPEEMQRFFGPFFGPG